MLYYILSVKWNQLTVVNDLFNIVLDYTWWYFIVVFLHLCSPWNLAFFFTVSFSGFGNKVKWLYKRSLESFFSFLSYRIVWVMLLLLLLWMVESCSESIWTQTSFMRHFITASTSLLVTYLYKLFSSPWFHFGRSYALKNLYISFSYSQFTRIEVF